MRVLVSTLELKIDCNLVVSRDRYYYLVNVLLCKIVKYTGILSIKTLLKFFSINQSLIPYLPIHSPDKPPQSPFPLKTNCLFTDRHFTTL